MSGMGFTDFAKKNVVDPGLEWSHKNVPGFGFLKRNLWDPGFNVGQNYLNVRENPLADTGPVEYGKSPYIEHVLEPETKARWDKADKDFADKKITPEQYAKQRVTRTEPSMKDSITSFFNLQRSLKKDVPASLEELDRLSKDPVWVANQKASMDKQVRDQLAGMGGKDLDRLAEHLEYGSKVLQKVGPEHQLDLPRMSPKQFNIGYTPSDKKIPQTDWEKLDYKFNPNDYMSATEAMDLNITPELSKGLVNVKADIKDARDKYIQDMIKKYGPWVLGGVGLAGLLLLMSGMGGSGESNGSRKGAAPGGDTESKLWNRFENWKW